MAKVRRGSAGLCRSVLHPFQQHTLYNTLHKYKYKHEHIYFKPGPQSQVFLQVVDIEIYGHVGLDLFIGVDCSVFLIHVRFVNSMKEPVHLIIRF